MSEQEREERTILYIEDEPGMIDLVRLILGKHNMKVLGALGAEAGIEIMKETKLDLVLLDIMMPSMDGWEVFKFMKGDPVLRDLPVIVVTARTQPIDVILARHVAKVDDYVKKPFGPSEILESVQRVLSRSSTSS